MNHVWKPHHLKVAVMMAITLPHPSPPVAPQSRLTHDTQEPSVSPTTAQGMPPVVVVTTAPLQTTPQPTPLKHAANLETLYSLAKTRGSHTVVVYAVACLAEQLLEEVAGPATPENRLVKVVSRIRKAIETDHVLRDIIEAGYYTLYTTEKYNDLVCNARFVDLVLYIVNRTRDCIIFKKKAYNKIPNLAACLHVYNNVFLPRHKELMPRWSITLYADHLLNGTPKWQTPTLPCRRN